MLASLFILKKNGKGPAAMRAFLYIIKVKRRVPAVIVSMGPGPVIGVILFMFKVPIWHLESSSCITSNIKSSPSKRSTYHQGPVDTGPVDTIKSGT